VVELKLSDKEKQEMQVSVSHVQELVTAMDKVLAAAS